MTSEVQKELREKIIRGEIDINAQENFFKALYMGFLYDINKKIKIRGCEIPHIVLNTGDDIMFLEVKGQDHSKEPAEVVNEDYVYNQVPRAMVQFNGVNMQTDQLTNPFARGKFSLLYKDFVHGVTAEFKRMPVKCEASVKYYLDNFSDLLDTTQALITNLAFVNDYNITYMGQTIFCTYTLPDSVDNQIQMEFDGITTDSKNRTVEVNLELESNIPIYMPRTVIFEDNFIRAGKERAYIHLIDELPVERMECTSQDGEESYSTLGHLSGERFKVGDKEFKFEKCDN